MAKSESLIEALQNVIALSSMLDGLKPLKKEDEDRLWRKFRLEWSFNSNHIEGNTLTYQQTELLLIFGKTTGDHDLREYQEMKAHDVAVELIRQYAKDDSRELTEADIRQLNETILVEPYWGNAITQDGQPTRKLIEPGKYKREPNSVKLQNGEMFHYASPEETPAKMKELIEWYRKATEEKKLHPVEIAAQFHYDFVRIHPFDDSNGRTSRLLMNYALLKNGYPPVIIKTADKKGYLTALNKADVGDLEAFVEYIARELIWSLKLNIKAAKGESIEEQDDIDKEINVWKKNLPNKLSSTSQTIKTYHQVAFVAGHSIAGLFGLFSEKHRVFDDLFTTNRIYLKVDNHMLQIEDASKIEDALSQAVKKFESEGDNFKVNVQSWEISSWHELLKANSKNRQVRMISYLRVNFNFDHYEIRSLNNSLRIDKKYSESISQEERINFVNKCVSNFFQLVRDKIES